MWSFVDLIRHLDFIAVRSSCKGFSAGEWHESAEPDDSGCCVESAEWNAGDQLGGCGSSQCKR